MNFKIIFFSAAALIASTVVNGQPELPECTIGVDTEACTTPFGHDGYFIHKVVDETTTSTSLRPGIAGGRWSGGGRGGGLGGRRGGRGGPRLSSSKCVPIDAPEPADGMGMGMGPFGGDFDGFDNVNRPIPQIECGCEDDVCPTAISCPCDCEITLPFGATMQGTKATITKRDGSTINKCVPPAYADADRFTCITDCSVEIDTPFLFN